MLPEIKKVKLPSPTLPTKWQTVIFRNYGYVKTESLANVLGCDAKTIETEATRLCLTDRGNSKDFLKWGYITIIRNNWYLLPFCQLTTLLDFTNEQLDFVLKNDDFLDVKLGGFKPDCPRVSFSPLTDAELESTLKIAKRIKELSTSPKVKPFEFFANDAFADCEKIAAKGRRIVHGYLSPCGDVFKTDCSDTLPDELLEKYRSVGINGIWLHGMLSALSPYPFEPSLSKDYALRRENLKKIIDRCSKYGIKVYLYFNEPRALPENAEEKYYKLCGWQAKNTLCLTKKEVKEYLYNAVFDLCSAVPDLGGIFTITMSENPTHCNYIPNTECPICKNIPPEKSAADVNNIIFKAMRDSGCKGELIANLWGWSAFMGWTDEQLKNGINYLEKGISVMAVSEYDLPIEKGGVKSRIIDYSISNPGPSEVARLAFNSAKKSGHRLYAKIQASNSWECSAVPYIPVFDLIAEHLENLKKEAVSDYFLTWTLGGYPSPAVEIASLYGEDFDLNIWYEKKFGEQAQKVHNAILCLCNAFREFPFSIDMLYNSPKNLGAANLWDIEPEDKTSTMVCYSFDDYKTWTHPYPAEIYVSQFKKLLKGWKKGIESLTALSQTPKIEEILRYAKACYSHFLTDLLQTEFALAKEKGNTKAMKICLKKEKENAKNLLALLVEDAKIGFEASNHYVYTERNLIEKIIRMEVFAEKL